MSDGGSKLHPCNTKSIDLYQLLLADFCQLRQSFFKVFADHIAHWHHAPKNTADEAIIAFHIPGNFGLVAFAHQIEAASSSRTHIGEIERITQFIRRLAFGKGHIPFAGIFAGPGHFCAYALGAAGVGLFHGGVVLAPGRPLFPGREAVDMLENNAVCDGDQRLARNFVVWLLQKADQNQPGYHQTNERNKDEDDFFSHRRRGLLNNDTQR